MISQEQAVCQVKTRTKISTNNPFFLLRTAKNAEMLDRLPPVGYNKDTIRKDG